MVKKIYRDGLEEIIQGKIKVLYTPEGHAVESYKLANGKRRFFVTLSGTHWCAHGDTIAQAVADAIWKDPVKRPSKQSIINSIKADGRQRKITLNEFREVTGACLVGCMSVLEKVGKPADPMTPDEIYFQVSKEWGKQLLDLLEWKVVES